MKIFFSALILGILLGAISTHYFSSPDAYQRLKEEKALLLEPTLGNENPEAGENELSHSGIDAEAPVDEAATAETGFREIPSPNDSQPPSTKEALPDPVTAETEVEQPEATNESPVLPENPQPENPEPAPTPEPKSTEDPEAIPEPETPAEVQLDGVAKAIRAQFEADSRIDAEAITIHVTDDLVKLTGTVKSAEVKRLAIEIAVFTEGVAGVEEELKVNSEEQSN